MYIHYHKCKKNILMFSDKFTKIYEQYKCEHVNTMLSSNSFIKMYYTGSPCFVAKEINGL